MGEKISFKNKNGLRLAGIWDVPKTALNKAIIFAHGLTADKDEYGIFVQLAQLLRENGFAVFRFDFNGHGQSEGSSINTTIKKELEDLDAALEEVKRKGYREVGLLGTSFGGSIAVLYLPKHPTTFKCLCLWNPVLDYDHSFLHPFLPWLKDQEQRILKDFKEKGWSVIGSSKFKIGKGLFDEMRSLFPYRELGKILIPTMIIHGDKDTIIPYEDSKLYANNIKGPHEFITIGGSDHGFHDNPNHATRANNATLKFFKKYL